MNKSFDPIAVISEELASIKNYIEAAQGVLKTGFMPSLAGLEDRVSTVCRTIQASPLDIQQRCLPILGGLLRQLNDCEEDMRAFNEGRLKPHGKP